MEEGSTSERHTLVKKDTKKNKTEKKENNKASNSFGSWVQCQWQWQQQTANEKENKCTNDVVSFL